MIPGQHRGWTAFIVAAIALAAAAGCAARPEASRQRVKRDPNLLLIYAACSIQPTIEAAKAEFVSRNSGKSADLVFDEPTKLAARIRKGEVPDIVIIPGEAEIGGLEADALVDGSSQQAFGGMRVVVMVPKGNPAQVRQPDDLLGSRVKTIAIATPGLTSAGTDARRELERANLWSKLQSKLTFKETPLLALQAVSRREVDAAVLYDPCLRLKVGSDVAPDSVEAVSTLTPESEEGSRIYAALHKQAPNGLLARRFLEVLAAQQKATPAPADVTSAAPPS
ncbi:MAG: molybdate ABC transporter substrate-binding protein [Armatimonadota bacterium]